MLVFIVSFRKSKNYLLCYTLRTVISIYVIRTAVIHQCMVQLASLFLLFFYYSIMVVPYSLPLLSSTLPTPTSNIQSSTPYCLCPWVLYTCPLTTLFLSYVNPLTSPLWLLSVCSSFPCLWLYFSLLFVLLFRFHI